MISFFQKKSSKPKKPEHEVIAAATHYREMTTFLMLVGFLIVGIVANFVSSFYDAAHSKPAIATTNSSAAGAASSSPEVAP